MDGSFGIATEKMIDGTACWQLCRQHVERSPWPTIWRTTPENRSKLRVGHTKPTATAYVLQPFSTKDRSFLSASSS